MDNIEKLKEVKKIVVHKHCHDGTTSAMIIKDVLHNVEVFYADHREKDYLNLQAEPGLLFCDISPPMARYKEFLDVEAVVLDHHETTDYIVREFENKNLGRYGHTDQGVSGAVLAYDEVWKPLKEFSLTDSRLVAKLSRLAGIRDTFQKDSIEWEDAGIQQSAVGFFDSNYLVENHLASLTDDEIFIGQILFERNKKTIERIVHQAFTFIWENKVVSIIPDGRAISDAAEGLRKKGSNIIFSFSFKTNEEFQPFLSCSARSDHSFSCSKFAEQYGGGGHLPAAGFSISLEIASSQNPYKILMDMLNQNGKACILY